jgi:hypothetical protein
MSQKDFTPQPHRHPGPVAGCKECERESSQFDKESLVSAAIERMRNCPDGSYMRCPFCSGKSKGMHAGDCPIEIVASAALSARGEPVAWRYTNKRTGDETFSNQPPDRVADLTLYNYVPLYVGVCSEEKK